MGKKRASVPVPVASCGSIHAAAFKKETKQPDLYAAFSAAYDGCAECVAGALDSGKVRVDQCSDHNGHDLVAWSKWGLDQGVGAEKIYQVLQVLAARGALIPQELLRRWKASTSNEELPRSSAPNLRCSTTFAPADCHAGPVDAGRTARSPAPSAGDSPERGERRAGSSMTEDVQPSTADWESGCRQQHQKACGPHNQGEPCLFYSAVYDGCETCVRHYIEHGNVHPGVTTDAGRTNALLWAVYGRANGLDADWVRGFLEGKGVRLPDKHSSEAGAAESKEQVTRDRNLQEHWGKRSLPEGTPKGRPWWSRWPGSR